MRCKRLFPAMLFFLLLFAPALAKSYSIEKADLYYKTEPDGLVRAEEKITFNFSGDFTFAYRDFEQGAWSYGPIKVFDITSGTPIELRTAESMNGADRRVTWYYSAHSERKTFRIEYTISRTVKAYSDVGEFY